MSQWYTRAYGKFSQLRISRAAFPYPTYSPLAMLPQYLESGPNLLLQKPNETQRPLTSLSIVSDPPVDHTLGTHVISRPGDSKSWHTKKAYTPIGQEKKAPSRLAAENRPWGGQQLRLSLVQIRREAIKRNQSKCPPHKRPSWPSHLSPNVA